MSRLDATLHFDRGQISAAQPTVFDLKLAQVTVNGRAILLHKVVVKSVLAIWLLRANVCIEEGAHLIELPRGESKAAIRLVMSR